MQGIDEDSDMLVYACAGMLPDPTKETSDAVLGATAGAEAIPVYDTAAVGAAGVVPRHHHHHHHRHLAQTPTSEMPNGWTVSTVLTPCWTSEEQS